MNRQCPVCGAIMIVRERRTDGRPFLGCSGYPQCQHTEQVVSVADTPNADLDLAAFSETASPIRDVAVTCLDSEDPDSQALARATLILLDYIVLWRKSDDPHAWDALDQAREAIKPV
jgi:ssDNA-binding Zn-finger/Zn-ribbon topoisomerase 1